jgi:2-keto-4-pentenoate hydratase/2-oxohepta-3-ene-1,7-dioic acid hydratase in catechol pathway
VLLDDGIAPAGPSVRALLTSGESIDPGRERIPAGDVRLLPPIPDPQKIICLGLTYRDHAAEAGQDIPGNPL